MSYPLRRATRKTCARGGNIVFVLALLLVAGPLAAQQAAGDAQAAQALARAQGLLRQIGQQKQQLEVDNARMKAELASLEKRLRRAEVDAEAQAASLAASERSGAQTAGRLERTEKRLGQTEDKLREVAQMVKDTRRKLAESEAAREAVEAELAASRQALASAEAANLELYRDNREILALYRNKGRWTGLLQDEPVTGLTAVEVENRIEEYEYKMYDHVLEVNLDAVQAGAAEGAPGQ